MSLLFPASPAGALHEERVSLASRWWLFLIFGIVSVVVGMVAISHAYIATAASITVLGVLLMVEGILEVIHAIMVRNWRGFALHLLAAALYMLVGMFMLEEPLQTAKVLTLLLTASFFVGGVLRIILSLVVRFHAWPWVLLTGVVDLILGIILWRSWPESSLWVIGLFVGIDLLFHGWSWIILSLGVRNYKSAQPA